MKKLAIISIVLASFFIFILQASAAMITQFTDRAVFNAATMNRTVIDFEGLAPPGGFTYYGTPGFLMLSGVTFESNGPLFVQNSIGGPLGVGSRLTFQQATPTNILNVALPANVSAVGFDFITGDPVTVTLSIGQSSQSFNIGTSPYPNFSFTGFSADEPISAIQVVTVSGADLDNFTFTSEAVNLSEKAAQLARSVVGAPYLGDGETWGGKGWDWYAMEFVDSVKIKQGYYFKNWYVREHEVDFDAGLDCSGLIFWSYNKTFGATKYQDEVNPNPVHYEGADGQFYGNTDPVSEDDLKPGDLVFFDKNRDGEMEHVAMYVGGEGGFDVVHASDPSTGIIWDNKEELKLDPSLGDFHFRRLADPKVGFQVRSASPVNLVVTDPDGFTITAETHIITELEYLREIPRVLYYTEWDSDGDGIPEDTVTAPDLKIGNYIIQVEPEPDALPTDTYSLEIEAADTIVILAQDVLIRDIPSQGYGIKYTGTEITLFIPVEIDIKPGSYPNCFNVNGHGVIPVAILGSDDFDVTQIDISTLKFAGLDVRVKGNSSPQCSVEDVSGDFTSFEGSPDGYDDLVCQFVDDASVWSPDNGTATLTGALLDGMAIKGSDSLCIVP